MCDQTIPELRKRMIREVADEIRKWVRAWLCRNVRSDPLHYLH